MDRKGSPLLVTFVFKVGDIICYRHNKDRIGVVIEISVYDISEEDKKLRFPIRFEQEQCYLIMWQTPNESGMRKWYVNENWIEKCDV